MLEVNKNILKEVYGARPLGAKKYDFGLVLVIGGSDFYSGSPALSAMAAFRSGSDMVRVIAPQRVADIVASFSANLATYSLEGKWLNQDHVATLLAMSESARTLAEGKSAVVIGGGVGRMAETQTAILDYLKETQSGVVVDADAIHAVSKDPEIIKGRNFLITPHTYEFFILTGKEVYRLSEAEKIKVVQAEAARLGTTILLKGKVDIISNGEEVAVNKIGSPYMTVGGCGDTLAGICGGLMARGVDAFKAAQAGVYINCKAGQIASKELKEGMLATDLIEAIPRAIYL